MPLSNIVNVQISRQTQSVSAAGFGTLLILGTNKNWNDLYRQYNSMQEVAVDFNPYDPEFIAAQDVFSQNITPQYILIGRRTVNVVDIDVETALSNQHYTTTINGTNVTIPTNTSAFDSTVSLSGIVTNVITFSTDFNTGTSSIIPVVNGVNLASTAWTTDQPTTIGIVATVISGAPGVTSAIASGDVITVTFASALNAEVNNVLIGGTGSQPTVVITQQGPLVANNLINVSLNGTILGTVTSNIVYSGDFGNDNVITTTVNGIAQTPVTWTTSQANTLSLIAANIIGAGGVTSATPGTDSIVVVFTNPGNNTINSSIATGTTPPTTTISEGGFTFATDNLTTMTNIQTKILAAPNITAAPISGVNNNIITISSNPNTSGVIDFWTITLGASQATASIVNNLQPTSASTIADAMATAINGAVLGVTAAPSGSSYSITANVSGVPYTVAVSTDIINYNQGRVVITQAIPNQTYSVKILGNTFSYLAPNNVTGNDQISAALTTSISSPILLDMNLNPILNNGINVPNPIFNIITATDNGNGSFEVFSISGTQLFQIVVIPSSAIIVQVGLIIGPYIPSLAIVTDLTNIQAVNNTWYALACIDRNQSDVLSVAAWIESQMKIFGTSSADPNIINEAPGIDTSSVAYFLNLNGYVRTFLIYHQDANNDYPECAWFGNCLPLTPGSETWMFKTLNTIPYSVLSSTQENNAFGKECNTYEYIGGVGITQMGTMAQGEYIDIIRGVDWLTSTIQSNVYSILVNNPKVPYTDTGITAVEAEIRSALNQGITNNFIASEPPYQIIVPLASSVPAIDKANRILRNVTFNATLAGAIQAINITGTVSV